MTDLNAESEILPVTEAKEDWKGHKVNVMIGLLNIETENINS